MATIPLRLLYGMSATRLREAGVAEPRLDARLLIQHALGLPREAFLLEPERPIGPEEVARVEALIRRREAREPVSRILGVREFWSLPFRLSPATLDPRPDSETLVEAVLARLPDRAAPLRLLDLGVGSGCLSLALLHELPAAWGLGVDLNPDAAAAARGNARDLGLDARAAFAVGRWDAALAGRFDVVVSNPPYIPETDMAGLEPEVRAHDPRLALVAGADGLDAYRVIAPALPKLLNPGGLFALEVGQGQADDVASLCRKAGLAVEDAAVFDLGGVPRVVVGRAAAR